MNHERDVRRLLDAWFTEGPVQVADRVVDGAADRIARQPQRAAWRLNWRSVMNAQLKLAGAVAAALVVAVVGYNVLSRSGIGAPGTETPVPTPSPTAAPTVVVNASPSITTGPRTVTLQPIAPNPFGWRVTLPSGWSIGHGSWYLYPTSLGGPAGNAGADQPNGLAVAFVNMPQVFVDSCDFGSMSAASSAAELVTAIQAKTDWVVSTPVGVTLGGYGGQQLDVTLPADLSTCGADSDYLVFGEAGTENGFYALGRVEQLRLWVLDANGRTVLLALRSFAASPATELAEGLQIIETSVLVP